MSTQTVVWRFSDGKAGHENQTQGLINAFARRTLVDSHTILIPANVFKFLYYVFSGRFYFQLSRLPLPKYLLAAGRSTQLPMLLAHLWFGGKRIVLMRPYWPIRWFDMLIIPQHDMPKAMANILVTEGVINMVTPSVDHNQKQGIILLGGLSKHYLWDTAVIIQQIMLLIQSKPSVEWTIINSRRTPENFLVQLEAFSQQLHFVDHRQTNQSWLPQQLASAGQIWVSPDSVSMLYEALSSGAEVGCFVLQEIDANNRIVKGINDMIDRRMITSFSQWQKTRCLAMSSHQLNEAQRAADWILNQ